jgi:hypothetical protein
VGEEDWRVRDEDWLMRGARKKLRKESVREYGARKARKKDSVRVRASKRMRERRERRGNGGRRRSPDTINKDVEGQAAEKREPGPVDSHSTLVYITSAYVTPAPKPTAIK